MPTEKVMMRVITVPKFDIKVFEITHAGGSVEKILDKPIKPVIGHLMGLPCWNPSPVLWMSNHAYV